MIARFTSTPSLIAIFIQIAGASKAVLLLSSEVVLRGFGLLLETDFSRLRPQYRYFSSKATMLYLASTRESAQEH